MEAHIPKSEWGPGPWQDEPDRLEWTDERTGLPCRIVRNMHFGNLCGYAGVPPTHPYYGWQYDDDVTIDPGDLADATIEDVGIFHSFIYAMGGGDRHGTIPLGMTLKAHQGVNFSDHIGDVAVWWFGFDCGHAWDLAPGMEATTRKLDHILGKIDVELPAFMRERWPDRRYRDIEYVKKEVTALAFQLRQLETRVLVDAGVLKFCGST